MISESEDDKRREGNGGLFPQQLLSRLSPSMPFTFEAPVNRRVASARRQRDRGERETFFGSYNPRQWPVARHNRKRIINWSCLVY
jgi:hypothetical protein